MATTVHCSDGQKFYLADDFASFVQQMERLLRSGTSTLVIDANPEADAVGGVPQPVLVNLSQVTVVHPGHS